MCTETSSASRDFFYCHKYTNKVQPSEIKNPDVWGLALKPAGLFFSAEMHDEKRRLTGSSLWIPLFLYFNLKGAVVVGV